MVGLLPNKRASLYTDAGLVEVLGWGLRIGSLPDRGADKGEYTGATGVRASFLTLTLEGVAFTAFSATATGGTFSRSEEIGVDARLLGGLSEAGESDERFREAISVAGEGEGRFWGTTFPAVGNSRFRATGLKKSANVRFFFSGVDIGAAIHTCQSPSP